MTAVPATAFVMPVAQPSCTVRSGWSKQEQPSMSEVKVNFPVAQVDGYPPVSMESVWAISTPVRGEYVVDNIPFFSMCATLGDLVSTHGDDEGRLWYESTVERSENSLIRVVLFDGKKTDTVRSTLRELGCSVETMECYSLLAVNIPKGTQLAVVQEYLSMMAAVDALDYEEPILRQ